MRRNKAKIFATVLSTMLLAGSVPTFGATSAYTSGSWVSASTGWQYVSESGVAYTGWVYTSSGWFYIDPVTGVLATGFKEINGTLYYFDTAADGIEGKMHEGWYQTNTGDWYFFNNNTSDSTHGGAVTGWQWVDGYCYFFGVGNQSGKMYADAKTPDGYQVDVSGHWVNESGTPHHESGRGFNTKGAISTGTTTLRSGGGGGSKNDHQSKKIQRNKTVVQTEETKKATPNEATPSDSIIRPEKIADGTWYGTGTMNINYETKGPDVVKIVLEDGKITEAEYVIYSANPSYKEKTYAFLKNVIGYSDTETLKDDITQALDSGEGSLFDAVSGATVSVDGAVSAIENAFERAKSYGTNGGSPEIDYMTFNTRPESIASGDTLDLSKAKLNLYKNEELIKTINWDELEANDITTSPEHGDAAPAAGESILVQFMAEDGLISIPTRVSGATGVTLKYADKIIVTYSDGTRAKIKLDESNFRYVFEPEHHIESMSIYQGSVELAAGVHDASMGYWSFDISNVEIPGGSDQDVWRFKNYYVTLDTSNDTTDLAKFTIDTSYIKSVFRVGEEIDLEDLIIVAETDKGNEKRFNSWSEAEEAGFSLNISDEYVFTKDDLESKTIEVSYTRTDTKLKLTMSFDVKVKDVASQIPATIELYSEGTKIAVITVPEEDIVAGRGYLIMRDNKLPIAYKKAWEENTTDTVFTVKSYNKDKDELETKLVRKGSVLRVLYPNLNDLTDDNGGYVWLLFTFDENTTIPEE